MPASRLCLDLAVIQMSVITYNETTSDAQNENSKGRSGQEGVTPDGINDVETAYFYSYPQEYYDAIPLSSASNERPVTRYRLSMPSGSPQMQIVGEVIDAALERVSGVGSVQFDVWIRRSIRLNSCVSHTRCRRKGSYSSTHMAYRYSTPPRWRSRRNICTYPTRGLA